MAASQIPVNLAFTNRLAVKFGSTFLTTSFSIVMPLLVMKDIYLNIFSVIFLSILIRRAGSGIVASKVLIAALLYLGRNHLRLNILSRNFTG